ncbi:predicted protein [Uncinocarpus reesii 1704]|uniref:Uncharacterized protein n=1 Tax=Uncinocarpus reesii (strain UAMH 1704) TaxID=336963 RepID=C4JPU2_UNCRE|nr:uncharacterized protein UREG_04585 [Uncinocarpus reesii 1704]EEP79739.1 predicted protein [Uncinocarpus reesii 1704]
MTESTTLKSSRRKRPSFSPVKPRVAALDFHEFSLLDEQGSTPSLGDECHRLLFQYLQDNYGVEDMWVMPPCIILRCPKRPDPSEKPFAIAGCLAFWLGMEDDIPSIRPGFSGGETETSEWLKIDQNLASDLKPFKLLQPETLSALLVQYFPTAQAISFIADTVIVEYAETDDDSWNEKLKSLPSDFMNTSVQLHFTNGLLANAEWKGKITSKPAVLKDMVSDDFDYVAEMGGFYPGAMLCSNNDDAITAGILVEKGGEVRLTVAFQCWEEEYRNHPDQKLYCVGVRVLGPKRSNDFLRDHQASPPDGQNVIMGQGIYATNDPVIVGSPQLRAGICGSVLVRLRRAGENQTCVESGEICGIMHWAELAMKYSTEAKFLCFADPMDPLIDDGWNCVIPPPKREEMEEENGPSKKKQAQ